MKARHKDTYTAKVLKERAQALRKPLHEDDSSELAFEGLVFRLMQETYVVDMEYVNEVNFVRDLTPLPCTPDFVRGIINLRGSVLSVIDIRSFLNLPATGVSDMNRLIMVQKDEVQLGILADEVLGSQVIQKEKIQSKQERFISGLYEEKLIILDLNKLLSSKDIIIDEEV